MRKEVFLNYNKKILDLISNIKKTSKVALAPHYKY